jgi:DHA1 family multidrug resistance protein-like MFS transporter
MSVPIIFFIESWFGPFLWINHSYSNTIIGLSTPSEDREIIFGVANSTTYLGNVLGPVSGGFIMIAFSLPAVFIFTGSLLLLTGLALPRAIKKIEKISLEKDKN